MVMIVVHHVAASEECFLASRTCLTWSVCHLHLDTMFAPTMSGESIGSSEGAPTLKTRDELSRFIDHIQGRTVPVELVQVFVGEARYPL